MSSGVVVLARQIRLPVTGGGTLNYISLSPTVLQSNFYCLDQVFLIRKTFFILKSDCSVALTRYRNLRWKMHFPAIYSMQNFDTFWPSSPTMVGIQAKLKLVKVYRNFSWYSFERLIRTPGNKIAYYTFFSWLKIGHSYIIWVISLHLPIESPAYKKTSSLVTTSYKMVFFF